MADPRVTDYIKRAREKDGLSDEVIKQNLRSVGWQEREIEEAFQAAGEIGPRESALEFSRETPEEKSRESFLQEEGFIEKPKRFKFSKKYIMPLIILVAFVFLASASYFVYGKFFRRIDPVSLLPQETAFYARVRINPENQQVKNLKELLNKFPYYKKVSQKISEEFEKLKEREPNLKYLDFSISDELIVAWTIPFEKLYKQEKIEELPLVFILPNPDLEKLEKLVKNAQEEIEKSGVWKIEKETYRGRVIVKAMLAEKRAYLKMEPATTVTDGHFVLATKVEDIKKIIDVAEDQKIINIFKEEKEKSINSKLSYQKIKKYFPKDYLALFYGEIDWQKLLQQPGVVGTVAEREEFLKPFTASLKAALNLPFFKSEKVEESEKIAFASAIIAKENELKTESYSLDLREEAFEPSSFSLEDSLANFVPEKIGNKEIAYYGEGRNLKGSFEYLEETLNKEMTTKEKGELDEFFKNFEETTGINLKEDIISLFEKNYAFFLASEPTGKETPSLVFIFEVDDENKAKENLLKISIPPIPLIPLTSPSLPSLSPEQIPQGKVTFSKEVVDGFEIYSLPVYSLPALGEFGLNFSIKEKKLIITLTRDGLVNILKSLSDQNKKRLKNSGVFVEQFNEAPKKVTSIEYSYPYGYLGSIKWGASFILNIFLQRIAIPIGLEVEDFEIEKSTAIIFEFLDKGVAPYLKVLKSSGSYSYSPEKGLIISKSRLIIEELPAGEKEATEEFWENIEKWLREKIGPIFPPVITPPSY